MCEESHQRVCSCVDLCGFCSSSSPLDNIFCPKTRWKVVCLSVAGISMFLQVNCDFSSLTWANISLTQAHTPPLALYTPRLGHALAELSPYLYYKFYPLPSCTCTCPVLIITAKATSLLSGPWSVGLPKEIGFCFLPILPSNILLLISLTHFRWHFRQLPYISSWFQLLKNEHFYWLWLLGLKKMWYNQNFKFISN